MIKYIQAFLGHILVLDIGISQFQISQSPIFIKQIVVYRDPTLIRHLDIYDVKTPQDHDEHVKTFEKVRFCPFFELFLKNPRAYCH